MSTQYYTGRQGEQYFALRESRRCQGVQEFSANVFRPYIKKGMTVLDFGCGTGAILASLTGARKLGVEVNEPSAAEAEAKGIDVYRELALVPDDVADVVISHHALEHIAEPLEVLQQLHKKLKIGGQAIIVVPAEEPRRRKWRRWHEDENKHLYSWNPVTLGNLMEVASFRVADSWVTPRGYSRFNAWSQGIPPLFEILQRLTARVLSRYATVCIGTKEGTVD